jgi:hypothetical protein
VVSIGWSTIVTDHDPLGHAETNALRQLKTFYPQRRQNRCDKQLFGLTSKLWLGPPSGYFFGPRVLAVLR